MKNKQVVGENRHLNDACLGEHRSAGFKSQSHSRASKGIGLVVAGDKLGERQTARLRELLQEPPNPDSVQDHTRNISMTRYSQTQKLKTS